MFSVPQLLNKHGKLIFNKELLYDIKANSNTAYLFLRKLWNQESIKKSQFYNELVSIYSVRQLQNHLQNQASSDTGKVTRPLHTLPLLHPNSLSMLRVWLQVVQDTLRLYKGKRIFYINYSSSSKACLAKSKIDFSHVRFSGVLSSSCISDSVSFSSILGPSSATTTGSCFFLRLG